MTPRSLNNSADRMQLLDSVRLLAAIAVIVSHLTTEFYPHNALWIVGSFSVPFYLFVALYFTVRGFKKDPSRSIPGYLLGRFVKLYLPFLVWNIAYDAMHLVKYPGSSMTPLRELIWAACYAHLYFLPLLTGVTLFTVLLIRPVLQSSVFRVVLSIVLVGSAVYWLNFVSVGKLSADPHPPEETLYHLKRTFAPALLAIVFAIWAGTRESALKVPLKLGVLGAVLMLSALVYQILYGANPILRSLSGFGLVLIAFTPASSSALRPVAFLGRYSYGIYLSHVAFIRIAVTIVKHYEIPPGVAVEIGLGLFALVCGAILSIALSQSRWTSWIVGMDATAKLPKPVTPAEVVSPLKTLEMRTQDPIGNAPH